MIDEAELEKRLDACRHLNSTSSWHGLVLDIYKELMDEQAKCLEAEYELLNIKRDAR